MRAWCPSKWPERTVGALYAPLFNQIRDKTMKIHLYARVSTVGQNLRHQVEQLQKEYPEGILYSEKLSGSSKRKPERERMIEALRAGDLVVATRLSRLSRSMGDMFKVFEQIQDAGANLHVMHESIRTDTSHGRLVFGIMAAINSWQRELIVESTSAGRKSAIANGVKFGRKPTITDAQRKNVRKLLEEGRTYSQINELTGISRAMIYLIKKPEKAKQFNQQHKLRLAGQRETAKRGE